MQQVSNHPFFSSPSLPLPVRSRCRMYSELISSLIASGGPHASRTSQVKSLRSVKREVLKLIETFIEKSEDIQLVAQTLVPAMLEPVLADYARNVPDARDAEVLSLFAVIVTKVRRKIRWISPDILFGDCSRLGCGEALLLRPRLFFRKHWLPLPFATPLLIFSVRYIPPIPNAVPNRWAPP